MPVPWLQFEGKVYWAVFVAAFLGMAVWETARPRRRLQKPLTRRWTGHAILFAIAVAITTVAVRLTPVAMAVAVNGSRFGVLNKPALPWPLRFVLALLALDLTRYAIHRLLHSTQLWRIHQVHHSDPDFDVATGARSHPLETLLAEGTNLGVIALLAPPASAVFSYQLLAVASNFFTHANVAMPAAIDRPLRWLTVTPDMHRVHHSAELAEQFSNFSEVFSIWDRLFRTYRPEPAGGHEHMVIGLAELQDDRSLAVGRMLTQPFRRLESSNTPQH